MDYVYTRYIYNKVRETQTKERPFGIQLVWYHDNRTDMLISFEYTT